MTHLAVSIMVESAASALAASALAAERGADLAEYRLDRFTDQPDDAARLIADSPLPCIVTIRPKWEGGAYEGDDQSRLALFEKLAAAPRPPVYLDAELAAWQRSPAFRHRIEQLVEHPGSPTQTGPALILSSHDFHTRPPDLLQRVEAMAAAPACRVIKLAWTARSLRDNLEAFELLAAAHKPTIAICMGRFGLPSRVLAKKFGALLTFASLDDADATAPGQLPLAHFKDLYRWDAINPRTRVYGVIGWPVGHSMSPAIHNAGFDATGHNGVYLPMPIPPEYEHFKATVGAFLDHAPLDFRGASVTIPHKRNLLRFIEQAGGHIEPLAKRIGAANTLTVRDDGSLHASNTDYAAALAAVCDAMAIAPPDLAGRRIAVIGAGGAARAIAAGFAHHGATVVIYNRTLEKAQRLADEIAGERDQGTKGPGETGTKGPGDQGKKGPGDEARQVPRSLGPSVPPPPSVPFPRIVAAPLANLPKSCCSVYINCTPIGMHPHTDATPMPDPPECLPDAVVFDTIYNPPETRLLREAKAAGAKTISGIEMFTRQAAAQFQQWTGQPAPRDLFDRIMRA